MKLRIFEDVEGSVKTATWIDGFNAEEAEEGFFAWLDLCGRDAEDYFFIIEDDDGRVIE